MGSGMGAYSGAVRPVESGAGETMLLWGLGQPTAHRNNALVRQAAHSFELDACGRRLSLLQSPSSMATPGVTGAVVWDSGVVLAKFLEHAADSQQLLLRRASGRPRIRMRPGGVRRRGSGSRSLYGAMILTMNWFGSHCPISQWRTSSLPASSRTNGTLNSAATM